MIVAAWQRHSSAAWQRHSSAARPPRTYPPRAALLCVLRRSTRAAHTATRGCGAALIARQFSRCQRPGKADVAKLLRASGARLLPGAESSSDKRPPPTLAAVPAAAANTIGEAELSVAWSTAASQFSPLARRLLVEATGLVVESAGVAVAGGADVAAGAAAGAAARHVAEDLLRERGATGRLGSYRAARAALTTDATAALARVPDALGVAACAALRGAIDAAGEGETDTVDQPSNAPSWWRHSSRLSGCPGAGPLGSVPGLCHAPATSREPHRA